MTPTPSRGRPPPHWAVSGPKKLIFVLFFSGPDVNPTGHKSQKRPLSRSSSQRPSVHCPSPSLQFYPSLHQLEALFSNRELLGNENSARSLSDRSFWKSLRVPDVRAFGPWISAPKCLNLSVPGNWGRTQMGSDGLNRVLTGV